MSQTRTFFYFGRELAIDDDSAITEHGVTDDSNNPDFVAFENELELEADILYDRNVMDGIEVGLNTNDFGT